MTSLHSYVRKGNLEGVKYQLNLPGYTHNDVNKTDKDGNTALHIACMRGDAEIAIALMEYGASRSIKNNMGQRAKDVIKPGCDISLSDKMSRMGDCASSDRYRDYASEADNLVVSKYSNGLYTACCKGDINTVRQKLASFTNKDIDQIQPNGSTALHAACYFNHLEIVRLLLKAGASRGIKNKHGCVPYEETTNRQIQALFRRIPGNNRFVGNTGKIEWIIATPHVKETAAAERHALSFYANRPPKELAQRAKEYYLSKELKGADRINEVHYFFEQALEKDDPEYIIKAYTAETGFYSRLNRDLAGGTETCKHERQYIVAIIAYHPIFDKYSYLGEAYRGLKMTCEDLRDYTVGTTLMTKSFLSSTKDEDIAKSFTRGAAVRSNDRGDVLKFPAFCTYIIKNNRTALAIENLSEYEDEKEILIMPYSVFVVKAVDNNSVDTINGAVINSPATRTRGSHTTANAPTHIAKREDQTKSISRGTGGRTDRSELDSDRSSTLSFVTRNSSVNTSRNSCDDDLETLNETAYVSIILEECEL